MAGGVGARFWPLGSFKLPKQFLPIAGNDQTMLQQTVKRVRELIPYERIFVVTNVQYINEVKKQVPKIPSTNIIGEPVGRNTAPCIGLAATMIRQFDEDGSMFVLPADHLIEDTDKFIETIECGIDFVKTHDAIVTMGIVPTHPETGYGYIQFVEDAFFKSGKSSDIEIYKVKTFAEKPSHETAKIFLESGDFLWNSGMFIFRADVILEQINKLLPDLSNGLIKIEKALHSSKFGSVLKQVFAEIKSISIDYGVMEKAKNVYVIKANFRWSDLGSWDEVYRIKQKDINNNSLMGNTFVKDSSGNLVISNKGFVGLIGVDDLIVVNSKDGLLICKKERTQEVKEIVDYLKRKGMTDFI